MDSVTKVNNACNSILDLTDGDINAAKEVAQSQLDYCHPSKGNKQTKYKQLGEHNTKVMEAVQNLRQILIDGKSI